MIDSCPDASTGYYGTGYLHFITTSCYQGKALLAVLVNEQQFAELRIKGPAA